MQFNVTVQRQDGSEYQSVKEATDTFSLYEEMRSKGETVLEAKKIEEGSSTSFFAALSRIGSVSAQDKITFGRNLGNMLSAGLPLARALSVMERQIKNKKFKKIIADVGESIRKGSSFHDALGKHGKVFPKIFIAMVKAGEESGTLSGSLKAVADQMERLHLLQKKIRGAMMYPAVIVSVMIAIGAFMMIMVVPGIVATFAEANVELPWSTRLIITLSTGLRDHLILVTIGLVAALGALWAFFRTRIGKKSLHFLLLKLPIVGHLIKETNTARTARTLSSLLSGGVDVLVSISITEEVLQNVYYKDVLGAAGKRVEKGDKLSAVFAEHESIYPTFLSEMVSVGEETGQISDMLANVANFYETEVERQTKDMSTIIEPFLMVAIGSAVGFFAFSMITPMYSLMESI